MALLVLTARVGAQNPPPPPADPAAAEEAREQRAMERFLSLLERNPRKGTALDRVYGYHVERGSLDDFIKRYQDRVAQKPNDGTGWLILGLLEFQRGQDAAAVTALARPTPRGPPIPCPLITSARHSSWSVNPSRPPPRLNAPSNANPAATTSSRSSRPWDVFMNARKKPTRRSWSGTVSKRSFPTTPAFRSRSPRPSPRKASPPWPCPVSRRSPNAPPIRFARSSSPCRRRT